MYRPTALFTLLVLAMMAILAQAAPAPTLEERQLGLLCPILGQPTCGLQVRTETLLLGWNVLLTLATVPVDQADQRAVQTRSGVCLR